MLLLKLTVINNETGMIKTLTLNREQAVNMLGADVGSLTEDKIDAISTMLKCIYKMHTTTRICRRANSRA